MHPSPPPCDMTPILPPSFIWRTLTIFSVEYKQNNCFPQCFSPCVNSSLSRTINYGLGGPGFESRPKDEIFLLFKRSSPAQSPPNLLLKWVPGFFPGGKNARRVNLTNNPDLVSRFRISGVGYTFTPLICLHGVTCFTSTSGSSSQIPPQYVRGFA